MNKVIFTITGPSASGKSTLERLLCDSGHFERIISTTTRPVRAGEKDGESYFFVTRQQFHDAHVRGEFLEVNEFGGNCYAASIAEFERVFASGKVPVIVVDPNGLRQISHQADDREWRLHSIFLTNSPYIRFERLLTRFVADIEHLELGGDKFDAAKRRFAERLALIETQEIGWEHMFRYDTYFRRFDELTANDVVMKLMADFKRLTGKNAITRAA